MSYLTLPLDSTHNRDGFLCTVPPLDDYLWKQAGQDMKKMLAVVFVLPDEQKPSLIKGYYTLSGDNIPQQQVPEEVSKKMPKYGHLPVTLLGRLAVDINYRGKGLGELLLLDALARSRDIARNHIGSIAVVVDPIDYDAGCFYAKYGFISLPDSKRMFLPMATVKKLFK